MNDKSGKLGNGFAGTGNHSLTKTSSTSFGGGKGHQIGSDGAQIVRPATNAKSDSGGHKIAKASKKVNKPPVARPPLEIYRPPGHSVRNIAEYPSDIRLLQKPEYPDVKKYPRNIIIADNANCATEIFFIILRRDLTSTKSSEDLSTRPQLVAGLKQLSSTNKNDFKRSSTEHLRNTCVMSNSFYGGQLPSHQQSKMHYKSRTFSQNKSSENLRYTNQHHHHHQKGQGYRESLNDTQK
uniref:Uncharacterized protein n=1 Tax=Romanomermis culicivorax TaxID=13658 RepID=A0A915K876_ROMCU